MTEAPRSQARDCQEAQRLAVTESHCTPKLGGRREGVMLLQEPEVSAPPAKLAAQWTGATEDTQLLTGMQPNVEGEILWLLPSFWPPISH